MTERYLHINRIADLIAAEITGRIDEEGREELERWKGESSENMNFTDHKIFGHLSLNSFVNIVWGRLLMNSRRE